MSSRFLKIDHLQTTNFISLITHFPQVNFLITKKNEYLQVTDCVTLVSGYEKLPSPFTAKIHEQSAIYSHENKSG